MNDAAKQRNLARYRRMKKKFRLENPLCAECKRNGLIRSGDEIDHIIPVKDRPDLFFEVSNLQHLCRKCHEEKTSSQARIETEDERKWREYIERRYEK